MARPLLVMVVTMMQQPGLLALSSFIIGWSDRVGTIEAGKFADLIAVAGDPLRDITELERVTFVMKNGTVYKHDGLK